MTGTGGPGSWQPDPEGRYEHRWWDGQRWTADFKQRAEDSRVEGMKRIVEAMAAASVAMAFHLRGPNTTVSSIGNRGLSEA